MRRENSTINTAFLSHEGAMLFNNDYYGSAELDRYACYVVADGLESGDIESQSARVAVQAAISAFQERPSIRAGALKRYVMAAHRALKENAARLSMKASITVVVTDYQTVRYAWAGNTRFHLYRAGRLSTENRDHSLSRQMADKGDLPRDKIALHEERSNLARYAGQPESLAPQVSKKFKLRDGDVFALITRGIWEKCDAWDIKAAIDSAENDPKLALDGLERLILDAHPEDIDNYTAAIVFVDKIYTNPNKGKKLKRILMIAIPILLVLVILAVVLFIIHRRNEAKRHDMQIAFLSAVEYIADENYPPASGELKTASDLASQLRDDDFRTKTDNYTKLVDSILNADTLLAAGSYEDAQSAYIIARDRSRFTDNLGLKYIERKLTTVSGYLSVLDLIALGDILFSDGNYTQAEAKYLSARQLASSLGYADGRKQAVEALEKLYEQLEVAEAQAEKAQAQANDAARAQSDALREASDMEAAGDKASLDNDLSGAKLYYVIARERFAALSDTVSTARIDKKLSSLETRIAQTETQSQMAAGYAAEGDELFDSENYVDAKVKYIYARNIYSAIFDDSALAVILTKIEACDSYINKTPLPEPPPETESADAEIAEPSDNPGAEIPEEPPADESASEAVG